MFNSTKAKAEKEKVLRKLLKLWRTSQDMRHKADLLLSKNPGLKNKAAPGNPAKS
jgi:hypothetical protein